jgi:hypothetical protein
MEAVKLQDANLLPVHTGAVQEMNRPIGVLPSFDLYVRDPQ